MNNRAEVRDGTCIAASFGWRMLSGIHPSIAQALRAEINPPRRTIYTLKVRSHYRRLSTWIEQSSVYSRLCVSHWVKAGIHAAELGLSESPNTFERSAF